MGCPTSASTSRGEPACAPLLSHHHRHRRCLYLRAFLSSSAAYHVPVALPPPATVPWLLQGLRSARHRGDGHRPQRQCPVTPPTACPGCARQCTRAYIIILIIMPCALWIFAVHRRPPRRCGGGAKVQPTNCPVPCNWLLRSLRQIKNVHHRLPRPPLPPPTLLSNRFTASFPEFRLAFRRRS